MAQGVQRSAATQLAGVRRPGSVRRALLVRLCYASPHEQRLRTGPGVSAPEWTNERGRVIWLLRALRVLRDSVVKSCRWSVGGDQMTRSRQTRAAGRKPAFAMKARRS